MNSAVTDACGLACPVGPATSLAVPDGEQIDPGRGDQRHHHGDGGDDQRLVVLRRRGDGAGSWTPVHGWTPGPPGSPAVRLLVEALRLGWPGCCHPCGPVGWPGCCQPCGPVGWRAWLPALGAGRSRLLPTLRAGGRPGPAANPAGPRCGSVPPCPGPAGPAALITRPVWPALVTHRRVIPSVVRPGICRPGRLSHDCLSCPLTACTAFLISVLMPMACVHTVAHAAGPRSRLMPPRTSPVPSSIVTWSQSIGCAHPANHRASSRYFHQSLGEWVIRPQAPMPARRRTAVSHPPAITAGPIGSNRTPPRPARPTGRTKTMPKDSSAAASPTSSAEHARGAPPAQAGRDHRRHAQHADERPAGDQHPDEPSPPTPSRSTTPTIA